MGFFFPPLKAERGLGFAAEDKEEMSRDIHALKQRTITVKKESKMLLTTVVDMYLSCMEKCAGKNIIMD